MDEKQTICAESAPQVLEWIRERGGVAAWARIDFSGLGDLLTPALAKDGTPTAKPHWSVDSRPYHVTTSEDDVLVHTDVEVRRFHVALRRGDNGLRIKLTDASTRKVRAAVEKAGKGAYYEFDYGAQEAVIMAPVKTETLAEWAARNEVKDG